MRILTLALAAAIGSTCLIACDREVAHDKQVEVKSDGTTVSHEKSVTEKSDGTVVTQEKKDVNK